MGFAVLRVSFSHIRFGAAFRVRGIGLRLRQCLEPQSAWLPCDSRCMLRIASRGLWSHSVHHPTPPACLDSVFFFSNDLEWHVSFSMGVHPRPGHRALLAMPCSAGTSLPYGFPRSMMSASAATKGGLRGAASFLLSHSFRCIFSSERHWASSATVSGAPELLAAL